MTDLATVLLHALVIRLKSRPQASGLLDFLESVRISTLSDAILNICCTFSNKLSLKKM